MKIKSTPYIVVYFIGGQHVVVLPFEEFPNGIAFNMASQRQRLIRELAAIRKVQTERPSWFRRHDDERLAREFASKSAELVALEITAYRKKLSR